MIQKEDVERIQKIMDNCHDFGDKIGQKIHSIVSFIGKHLKWILIIGIFGPLLILSGFIGSISKNKKG
ncbi:MAG TPA: hypothetical protein PLI22_01890 [Caldisericia bacterium]|nr:hypothetical protein [Caldisericia bacterium]